MSYVYGEQGRLRRDAGPPLIVERSGGRRFAKWGASSFYYAIKRGLVQSFTRVKLYGGDATLYLAREVSPGDEVLLDALEEKVRAAELELQRVRGDYQDALEVAASRGSAIRVSNIKNLESAR